MITTFKNQLNKCHSIYKAIPRFARNDEEIRSS